MSIIFNKSRLICSKSCRFMGTNDNILPMVTNRNPRNLEKLRIAYKPQGYHVEKKGRSYWHKLELHTSGKHTTASVVHYLNGEVLRASTQEWAIKKQLYKTKDTSAFINVGRVLAQRCLESGILEMVNTIETEVEGGKVDCFLKALKEGGVVLEEPTQYKKPNPWDQHRPEKPWEVTE